MQMLLITHLRYLLSRRSQPLTRRPHTRSPHSHLLQLLPLDWQPLTTLVATSPFTQYPHSTTFFHPPLFWRHGLSLSLFVRLAFTLPARLPPLDSPGWAVHPWLGFHWRPFGFGVYFFLYNLAFGLAWLRGFVYILLYMMVCFSLARGFVYFLFYNFGWSTSRLHCTHTSTAY